MGGRQLHTQMPLPFFPLRIRQSELTRMWTPSLTRQTWRVERIQADTKQMPNGERGSTHAFRGLATTTGTSAVAERDVLA